MTQTALRVRKQAAEKRLRYLRARAAVDALILEGRRIHAIQTSPEASEAVIPNRARVLAIGFVLALVLGAGLVIGWPS